MDIIIDLSFLDTIPTTNPVAMGWWFFAHGGFIIVLWAATKEYFNLWLHHRQHAYIHSLNYKLLAIDVPRETEQSPKALENMFSALRATYSPGTLYERYWLGKTIDSFSFEIVSLGGYIQFLVRTRSDYRDLIEASIYAQYPDAEINEVEDYVNRISPDFNTNAYDLWGTEFSFTNKQCYPIRTYQEFEHTLSGEFKDPMAALLEMMSRLNNDEDIWLQLVVTPADDHWRHAAESEIKKIVEGNGHASEPGIFSKILFVWPIQLIEKIGNAFIPFTFEHAPEKPEKVGMVSELTPIKRDTVAAIETKLSKIAFYTKFRVIYWARRESFLKGRGAASIVGAIQQFTATNRNGLIPNKVMTTKAEYFLKQSRINRKQRRILKHYQSRDVHKGMGHGVVLTTEELASLYHFPVVQVRAPLIKKTEVKKAEPPFTLPVPGAGFLKPIKTPFTKTIGSGRGNLPINLPFVD